MILSVSRRTDVPNYYSDWFYNRLREGFLYVKNPVNMMKRLDELKAYPYYFQFTLTGYGRDVEPALPDKRKELIPTFQSLSRKIALKGYTRKVVISFMDLYTKTERNTRKLHIRNLSEEEMRTLAGQIVGIAGRYDMQVESCAEAMDLQSV